MPRVGIGLRKHRVQLRHTRVRNEPLGSVEDVLVTFAASRRAHGRRVGTGAGLGERICAEPLSGRKPRQVSLLLLLIARELDAERPELLSRENQAARGADFRDLLDGDERQEGPRPEPSVLLVEEEPEEVVLPEELDDIPGKLVALVDLRRPGRNSLARELTDEITDLALLLGQWLVRHAGESSFQLVAGRPEARNREHHDQEQQDPNGVHISSNEGRAL